jgi:hypothetical protein
MKPKSSSHSLNPKYKSRHFLLSRRFCCILFIYLERNMFAERIIIFANLKSCFCRRQRPLSILFWAFLFLFIRLLTPILLTIYKYIIFICPIGLLSSCAGAESPRFYGGTLSFTKKFHSFHRKNKLKRFLTAAVSPKKFVSQEVSIWQKFRPRDFSCQFPRNSLEEWKHFSVYNYINIIAKCPFYFLFLCLCPV